MAPQNHVSLLDYVPENGPRVGVGFPAGIGPVSVLQDRRRGGDKELN